MPPSHKNRWARLLSQVSKIEVSKIEVSKIEVGKIEVGKIEVGKIHGLLLLRRIFESL